MIFSYITYQKIYIFGYITVPLGTPKFLLTEYFELFWREYFATQISIGKKGQKGNILMIHFHLIFSYFDYIICLFVFLSSVLYHHFHFQLFLANSLVCCYHIKCGRARSRNKMQVESIKCKLSFCNSVHCRTFP